MKIHGKFYFEFGKSKKITKKQFWVLILIVAMGFSSVGIMKYIVDEYNRFGKSLDQSVTATIMYDDALISGDLIDLGTNGLQVAIWENGEFLEYVSCNALSSITFSADLTKMYILKITQGTTIIELIIDIYGVNDFLIGGWQTTLTVLIGGVADGPALRTVYYWTGTEWLAVGDFVFTDGLCQALELPIGMYGVISEEISGIYNFEIVQTDVEPVIVTLDIIEKTSKPKIEFPKFKIYEKYELNKF